MIRMIRPLSRSVIHLDFESTLFWWSGIIMYSFLDRLTIQQQVKLWLMLHVWELERRMMLLLLLTKHSNVRDPLAFSLYSMFDGHFYSHCTMCLEGLFLVIYIFLLHSAWSRRTAGERSKVLRRWYKLLSCSSAYFFTFAVCIGMF